MGYIYYCKNLVNNKGYVGQTKRTLSERKKEHFSHIYSEAVIFHKALSKYGKENFEWSILGEYEDSLLDEKETYWIKEKNTHFKDGYGYNMSYGGETHFGVDVNSKKVMAHNLKTNEKFIYSSMHEAARQLSQKENKNFNMQRISHICHGNKGAYSYFDYTFSFLDENNNIIPTNFNGDTSQKRKGINIVAINENDEKFYFSSLRKAEEGLKINRRTIAKRIEDGQSFQGYTFYKA